MSREPDFKRLKKSLYETKDILNGLITETSSELEKNWDVSRKDISKNLMTAGKRFEKTYEQAKAKLDSTIKGTSKDLEKQYYQSKKEAEKALDKGRDRAKDNYRDLNAEARKRMADAKLATGAKTQDLKFRSAGILQGVAAGLLALRNKLEPNNRYAIRNEKEKHHLGKNGYFKRFFALALVIVAKKDLLLNLGSQLYHKLQDKDAREGVKDDALAQYDTLRRLIKAYANGEYREFPYMSIVKIVAAVVYFVSVVDLVPDFIPILGLTDDLAILAWVYASVKDDLQNFTDWEEANERRQEKMNSQKENSGSTTPKTTGSSPVADRDASPNAGAARSTTTPSATASVGASSSVINNRAAEGTGKDPDNSGAKTGGSASGSTGGATSGTSGTNFNADRSSTGSGSNSSSGNTNSGNPAQGSSAQQGGSARNSGGGPSSSGGNAGK